jgi:hypothetical protein
MTKFGKINLNLDIDNDEPIEKVIDIDTNTFTVVTRKGTLKYSLKDYIYSKYLHKFIEDEMQEEKE